MPKKRNITTYELRQGRKVVHRGITNNPERRESEHQEQFPNSKLTPVGRAKTKEGALEWEKGQNKTITPKKK